MALALALRQYQCFAVHKSITVYILIILVFYILIDGSL